MVRKIGTPTRVAADGTRGKVIEEFIGRVNTGTGAVSVAHMISPSGWSEPFQAPEFDEVTIVLRGRLRIEHSNGTTEVGPDDVVLVSAGERIRYSTPFDGETEYWAICVPAFSPETVHRESA
ncbi:MAG: cupin [Candidatus Hydrogenedentes bacterium]|nr:cupin [Candidatus Hydrogenedentota bacterium]